MDFLWFLLVGVIAGGLAKMVMPGDKSEPKGCLMTMLLGIAGAMITGFIIKTVMGRQTSDTLIGSIIGATLGALLLIWLMRRFVKNEPAG